MQAIELETQIQNDGQICLPERYANKETAYRRKPF